MLTEDGVLSKDSLEEALNHQKAQGGLLGQILIRLGYISEENLVAALSRQLNIPYLALGNYSTNMDIATSFDEQFCRQNLLVVFDQDDKRVYLGVADPLNDTAIEEIEKKSKLKPQIFISCASEVLNMLDIAFSAKSKKEPPKKSS